jgi:hypothetical protein
MILNAALARAMLSWLSFLTIYPLKLSRRGAKHQRACKLGCEYGRSHDGRPPTDPKAGAGDSRLVLGGEPQIVLVKSGRNLGVIDERSGFETAKGVSVTGPNQALDAALHALNRAGGSSR